MTNRSDDLCDVGHLQLVPAAHRYVKPVGGFQEDFAAGGFYTVWVGST
jgi:hypothetical protein